MSLKVTSRKIDGVVVIDMIGRLTGGEGQLLLRSTIRRFLDDGANRFVLNLSDVSFIDSSGLGELVSTKSLLTSQGGRVNLLGLTKRGQDLLVLTRLVVLFDFFDEESKAVKALHGDPESQNLSA